MTVVDRSTSADNGVRTLTTAIINRVRREGDVALHELSFEPAASLAPDVAVFAEAERLCAHAAAARQWGEELELV